MASDRGDLLWEELTIKPQNAYDGRCYIQVIKNAC